MSRRSERVAEAIRREVSMIVTDELRDPRIGFVTITRATISDDLRNALIFYSVLGDEKAKRRAASGLASALSYIKTEVGHRIKLRYIPEIRLRYDDRLDYAQRIEDTLRKINEEKGGRDAE